MRNANSEKCKHICGWMLTTLIPILSVRFLKSLYVFRNRNFPVTLRPDDGFHVATTVSFISLFVLLVIVDMSNRLFPLYPSPSKYISFVMPFNCFCKIEVLLEIINSYIKT